MLATGPQAGCPPWSDCARGAVGFTLAPMSITWRDIAFQLDPDIAREAAKAWSWLVPEPWEPIVCSMVAGIFLEALSGEVHWLNTGTGLAKPVAQSREHFQEIRQVVAPPCRRMVPSAAGRAAPRSGQDAERRGVLRLHNPPGLHRGQVRYGQHVRVARKRATGRDCRHSPPAELPTRRRVSSSQSSRLALSRKSELLLTTDSPSLPRRRASLDQTALSHPSPRSAPPASVALESEIPV